MFNRILNLGHSDGHRRTSKSCLYVLIMFSLISACGQKGDLYLPEEQALRTTDSQSQTG